MSSIKNIINDRDFRRILLLFVLCKIFVISIAAGTQFVVPQDISNAEKVTDNIFLNPFAQYDATAYLDIAENGYHTDFGEYKAGNYHWYPLYPLLIKIFGFAGYPLAAFLVSNITSFLAIAMLWVLVRDEMGKKNANKTVMYTILFPTAFYFTMMYTESIFLLLSVSVFYFAKEHNWPLVGLFGFLAALARMQGLLLLIPIAYIYLRDINFNLRKIKPNSLYLMGTPFGTLSFVIYEYLITGNPFIQFASAVAFGKYLSLPWEGLVFSIKAIFIDTTLINVTYHIYTLFLTVSFLALLYVSYKKLKAEYTIYFGISMLVILISSNLFGITRYMLVAFPAFMSLALIDRSNRLFRYGVPVIYAMFILLMAGFIVLHVTERATISLLYMPLF